MKTIRQMLFLLMGSSLFIPNAGWSEDIDIYSGLTSAAGRPNVLFILDNAAAFSSSSAGTSCIIDGVATNMSGTVGGVEQCALYSVINGLPTNADGSARINIGMMMYNGSGISDVNGANCDGTTGGCLAQPLIPMDAAHKASFMAWIKSWRTSGGSGYGYVKTSGEATAASLQEAWAYYKGETGLSGRSYAPAGDHPAFGCQKNYVIFVGNAFASAGSPGDASTVSAALNAAPGVTTLQKALILDTISTDYTSTLGFKCGPGSYTFKSSGHDTGGFYADEWSRYMNQSDLYAEPVTTPPTPPTLQNIITYSVGLLGPNCQESYAATLASMALKGGGKYFPTTNYEELKVAILKILNEVQAVNSVFASSSLPVSVNAQGTYLNQIYMGMFRPDDSGLPRWVGNLKQYKFGYEQATQTLSLVDSLGAAAISSAGTGFITPNAVSYWTTKNESVLPDSAGGFWKNKPQGAGLGLDYPDGEMVEKGGSAQVSRKSYLLKDYSTAAGSSTNPRKVYTYCPGDSSCEAALTNSANAFSTTNGNITASMFGTKSWMNIASITRGVSGGASTATATTSGNHGFSTGDSITVTGAVPTVYNGTFTISVTGANTFTYPVTEYPPSPATGSYQASLHNTSALAAASLTRSSSTTSTANTETVTVTTSTPHSFASGDSVDITGASPGNYNGTYTVTAPSTTTITYPVTVTPPATATGSYAVKLNSATAVNNSTLSYIYTGGGTKSGTVSVTTATPHGFVNGDYVTVSGVTPGGFNGSWTITKTGASTFTYLQCSGATPCGASLGTSGTAVTATVKGTSILGATQQTITSLTRTGTAYTVNPPYPNIATATIGTGNRFATGNVVDIVALVPGANEAQYYSTGPYTITCTNVACTTFTYPINTSPALPASGSITAAPHLTAAQNISSLTRTFPGGATVTATLESGSTGFVNGDKIDISKQTGTTPPSSESAYTVSPADGWTITCVGASPCTTFTYGPIELTPGNSTTGGTASKDVAPDKNPLINWVRGEDNFGDEASPDMTHSTINIRPSLHGDVLHSRPTVINYGGSIGVAVFYGSNDGVYRAVNGNQTASIGSVPPGGELWSFIPTEFFGSLQRMHDNNPVLLLSSTPPGIVPPPQKKDYFVDGSTSVYLKYKADNTADKAYLYLAMRRGGRLIYALDVSDPTNPMFMWKIDNASDDFSELGQTWSQPKTAFVKGYNKPVLIFGAGYDANANDIDGTPATATMGRGIYIVDATTGNMVWSATYGSTSACSGTSTKASCTVAGMDYSIPADITLADRSDNDGYIDRLYAVDTGGNIWRVDLEPAAGNTPDKWQVTQLAALGCTTGACASGTTPRKFFYPADIVQSTGYDQVFIGSGDREHPLSTQQSYTDINRFYMVKDLHQGNDATASPLQDVVTEKTGTTSNLKDLSTAGCGTANTYDGTLMGYYVTLCSGEKVVNAPLTVAGYTYFGTNTPGTSSTNSCTTNLGIAKGYRINTKTGTAESVTYDGGGLPPSPVAGMVEIHNGDGTTSVLPFCIGCANPDSTCKSALCGEKPKFNLSKSRQRTYWYIETD